MIGGTVIEIIVLEDRVWINCREEATGNVCAIYVERSNEARCVSERDTIRWEGEWASWNAKDRQGRALGKPNIQLKRIGLSGVKRPVPAPRPEGDTVASTSS